MSITILLTFILAGSEKYRSITTGHYRFALGAVLMYDISNADTFKNCRYWLENIKTYADDNVVIALVGKIELPSLSDQPNLLWSYRK